MTSVTAAFVTPLLPTLSLNDEVGSTCAANDPGLNADELPAADDAAAETEESPRPRLDHARMFCLLATRDGGVAYDGDLLADVIDYRDLRALHLRGALDDTENRRLEALEDKLRQPSEDDDDGTARLRTFYRWSCQAHAVVFADDESRTTELPVIIEDMSAGGVKAVAEHGFVPGDAVDLRFSQNGSTVEFPSRVAWVRDKAFGMMFAGAARRGTQRGQAA